MAGTDIVTSLVSILVSGITQLGTGIGGGVNNFVSALAIDSTGSTPQLSIFVVFIAVFGALALGIGLTRRCFNMLASLGGSR